MLCHQPLPPHCAGTAVTNAGHFIVNGQSKVIVAQERLINNHPLVSCCVLQTRQVQYTCEVRSVPASNTNRFPVVFALRATLPSVPELLPAEAVLGEPLIVTLTYFRRLCDLYRTYMPYERPRPW